MSGGDGGVWAQGDLGGLLDVVELCKRFERVSGRVGFGYKEGVGVVM